MISNRTRWICLGMVTAAMLAGCSASSPSASVAAVSGTTRVPAATLAGASATADPVMAQHDAAVARATAVIHALGGDVSADEPTTVLVADPESSQPGPFVQIGDADHRWEVGWTPQGVLRWVFTVTQPDAAAALTQTQAAARVSETLARLGLSLGAPDSLVYGSDWSAEWSRKIDGVPALGDGTSLHLAPDGSFGSYRFAESATAPKPASLLAKTQALSKFPLCRNSAADAAKTETCTTQLVWVRPVVASPDDPLRLCWELKYHWTEGEGFGGSVEYLDAGTGDLVDSMAES